MVTVGDMVRAQAKLIDHLGIDQLLSIAGGSMGGMQVLEWAANHPQRVRSAIPLATTAQHSPMLIAFSEVGRQAIYADPVLEQRRLLRAGDQTRRRVWPWRAWSGHITYLSEESMQQKFGRRLRNIERYGYEFETEFEIESYLKYNGNSFTRRFDANTYLYVTKAMDYFDLTQPTGSLAAAFYGVDAHQVSGRQLHQRLALSQLSQQATGQRTDCGRGRRHLSWIFRVAGGMMRSCWRSKP